jgi:hypothetical protein
VARRAGAAAAHRARLNEIYASGIPADVQYPAELQVWRFHVAVPRSQELLAAIFAAGLFASRHYSPLAASPVAERVHRTIVNLFNDHHFTAEQARAATAVVARHLGR